MAVATLGLSPDLHNYLLSVQPAITEAQQGLREETAKLSNGGMQISAEQGHFMGLLIKILGAKKTLEIGVFTGYSSLTTALALPEDGKIVALDVSEDFTRVARRYWAEAGVANKIDLRIAPARESLESLLSAGEAGTFDFAFIDADKPNYDHYYEAALKLVRQGGVIAIDNTLWAGRVADDSVQDDDTNAFRVLNAKIAKDERVDRTLTPIGDGLTLCRKR